MPTTSPGSYVADTNQFMPPHFGGDEAVEYGAFTFADTTARTVFTLPKGAVITDFGVNVTTVFNSSGTDLLDAGITGTGDFFVNDLAVSATGHSRAGVATTVPSRLFTAPLDDETNVTIQYTQGVADATTGAGVFYVRYILMSS